MGREQGLDLGLNEPARPHGPDVPVCRRTFEQGLRHDKISGERAGDNGRIASGHDEADMSSRTQHRGDCGQGRCGIVNVLEHTVTQHEVERSRRDVVEQIGGVALNARDGARETSLGATPMQRGKGIRARVDDRDPVSELRQSYGVTTRSSTEVEHVKERSFTGQVGRVNDCLPHQL